MQLDEENDTKDEINENENNIDETEQIKNDNKKVRLFSAKDFRKQINKGDKLTALKQFLNALNTSKKHDYIFEYLESGGSCLELLHILELDSAIPPSLVFELVTHLLLKISINYPQYQSASYESCRYILNNYIAVINKMINLSSTSQERKACLKLLTAMVTFSSNLAKDILLQVNFHSTNIELLTKSTGEKDSVRDYFIHFLTAFLVDGNYPTLSTLLEKKGFIKSIIAGLQFDSADTVCVVISGMKNHILENPLVSKTAKMKVFNTQVVRDIVNLYNWKGPAALRAQKKNKSTAVVVDEYSKSKVSECVHDFLLVLCTSHRYGVIFKDHLLGLGKKNQNALMYTVLESLERPWEHSYACELVTKICGACPDLAKTMWNNLKTFLEPRMTPKWLNALKFAKILLKELQPACIEFCVKELGVYQLAQVIQFLVAPLPILKIVIPDNHTFEQPSIKKQVMSLLLQILTSLEVYVSAAKGWLSLDNHRKLKTHITNHVARNFPDAKTIIDDWEHTDEPEVDKDTILTQSKFLEVVFDIFELYKKLAPQLLDTLSSKDLGITEFLEQIDNVCTGEDFEKLKIKIISIFIDVDQSQFSPKTDAFSVIFPLLLQFYCSTKDPSAFSCLRKLLKNTGIFDGCFYEINIWLNGILDLKNFDETVAQNLVETLKMTYANALEYTEEFSKFKSRKNVNNNISEIIENLLNDVVTENKITVKHRHLSPMTIGYLKHLSLSTVTKSDKVYSNFVFLHLFHCQTDDLTQEFFQSYDALPKNVKEYFLCWTDKQEIAIVKKSKGKFDIFHNFSKEFLTGNLDDFMPNCDLTLYDDLPLNLLQMSIFYISNLVNNATLTKTVIENCEKYIKFLLEKNLFQDEYAETILGHPVLLNNVSFISLSKEKPKSLCTRFLLNVINQLINSGFNIESYLRLYRERLLTDTVRILKKPGKYNELHNFIAILEMFGFSYEQCLKVLSTLQDATTDLNEHVPIIYDVLTYCLERLSHLCESDANLKPLSSERVQRLTTYYLILTEKQEININKMTVAFHSYFKIFPHNIKDINNKLFQSILNRTEYSKENVGFALFLLDKNLQFFASIKDDLDNICNKKGVILPLIALVVDKNYDEQVLIDIFFKFEAPLAKALQKPQKAGQHFHQNYKGLVELITRYMAIEKCESILEKVQKFEVAEIFHAKLLEAVCKKAINSDTNNMKVIRNAILTFVHLQMTLFKRKTKSEDDPLNMDDIALSFNNLLSEIYEKRHDQDLKTISENETLKLYVKFCLKFGVSGQPILLRIVRNLVDILASCMKKEDGRLILDMLLSHSEFLDNMLGEHSDVKMEMLSLFLVLCRNWNDFMERGHIPVLLAAYRAMVNKCDRMLLALLKMYESRAGQTGFYEFKPYLWGKAAASHYSVRLNIENALWRQPKMGDILDILEDHYVTSTITNYPVKENLHLTDSDISQTVDTKSYDLKFLLPLFSQLLAPEQQVQTYRFTRSGALSLTVVGLSSQDKEVRQAACHVLSRFHSHVDARQSGKDNLLWLRYIEAVCKGTADLRDFKLNSFSAIYLARMALVLTQPNHVMYIPLSQHLTAKASLDFGTVPELYTFLHSSDVNYREHRSFILELLRDGVRTEKDFTDFTRSMAFKLFSELYSSCVSDVETRLLILDVINAACKVPSGVKMLCENHSLLAQVYTEVHNILKRSSREKQDINGFINKIVGILISVVTVLHNKHSSFTVFNILMSIIKDDVFESLKVDIKNRIFEILTVVFSNLGELFSDDVLRILLSRNNNHFCKYILEYGCQFVNINEIDKSDEYYYMKLLFYNKIKN